MRRAADAGWVLFGDTVEGARSEEWENEARRGARAKKSGREGVRREEKKQSTEKTYPT